MLINLFFYYIYPDVMLIQYFLSIAVTLPLHVTVIHCDYGKKRRRKKKGKKELQVERYG